MKLSDKYNIPQSTVNKMVTDGIISTTWPRYEEVSEMFKAYRLSGKKKWEIYIEISEKTGMSENTIRHIIQKTDKI